MPKPYKAVLFDLDDTLIKTWEVKWAQHKFVARKYYGLELTDETLNTHWGKGFDVLTGHLYNNADTAHGRRANYLRHEDEFPKQVHDDAVAMIDKLLTAGIVLGVITSMTTEILLKDLREHGFPYAAFTVLQGSDQTLMHKPDPAVFDPALTKLKEVGIAEGILYVGDALNDFYASQGADLDFVGVTSGFVDKASFQAAGAKKVVTRLRDLPPLILRS